MLQRQTYSPFEIIIVDQSTIVEESDAQFLKQLASDGVIQWLIQTEPNASSARNRGAMAANGDVILLLDDDIRMATKFIESHAQHYLDPLTVGVAGQILEGEANTVTCKPDETGNVELDWMRFPKNYSKPAVTGWMASGNVSIRRNVFLDVGGMDETYWKGAVREESDFALRFIRKGFLFKYDPQAWIYHIRAPAGGARVQNNHLNLWKHFFGHWYFIFGFASTKTIGPFLSNFFRSFVFNKTTLKNPLTLLIRISFFLFAAPIALFARIRNRFSPRTITPQQQRTL